MSKLSCNVIRDLLPTYLDGICSEESKLLVEEHLADCEKCKAFVKEIHVQETKADSSGEQVHYFKKAKKYIDSRYRLALKIALFFAILIVLYSISDSSYIPPIFTYVSIPLLMGIFFVVQPTEQNREKKYMWLQMVSTLISIFLPVFHFIFVNQVIIVLNNPQDERIWKIFDMEPYKLGPIMADIYLTCVIMQVILLVAYYFLGRKKKQGFILGQNLSWFGVGLGLQFQALLFKMFSPEAYIRQSLEIVCIMFGECLLLFICNLIYVKRKPKDWLEE